MGVLFLRFCLFLFLFLPSLVSFPSILNSLYLLSCYCYCYCYCYWEGGMSDAMVESGVISLFCCFSFSSFLHCYHFLLSWSLSISLFHRLCLLLLFSLSLSHSLFINPPLLYPLLIYSSPFLLPCVHQFLISLLSFPPHSRFSCLYPFLPASFLYLHLFLPFFFPTVYPFLPQLLPSTHSFLISSHSYFTSS